MREFHDKDPPIVACLRLGDAVHGRPDYGFGCTGGWRADPTQVNESGQEPQDTDPEEDESETDASVPDYDEYLSANGEVTYPSQETSIMLQEMRSVSRRRGL